MAKIQISATLDENLVAKIDKKRGLVSRSAYIEMLVRKAIKLEEKQQK